MPPRITQKSCRPRVSHRIVVGTFSQRLACVASEPNGVEHRCFMKPSSWDKQLGLASPLECAASQSGQTNNPSKECGGAGCKSPYPHLPEGRGEAFFLDILFHRMSDIGILRQLTMGARFPGGSEPTKIRLCTAHSSSLSTSYGSFPHREGRRGLVDSQIVRRRR